MFPLIEFLEMAQLYGTFFNEAFSAEALIELLRYISGSIVSENKTDDWINRPVVY
jgi:hypothetical protein